MENFRIIYNNLNYSHINMLLLIFLFIISFALTTFIPNSFAFKPPPINHKTDHSENLTEKIELIPAPKSWGLPIKDSSGYISYKKVYNDKKMNIKVKILGLLPLHSYVFSINGKHWHKSNNILSQRYGNEGYFDFAQVMTDNEGNCEKYFSLNLPADNYNVKFLVKDPKSWKVVLYNDFFIFTIK